MHTIPAAAGRTGLLWYDGMLWQAPTRIYGFMAEQKLVKLRVFISTPDEDALTVYQNARAELIKQYGAPKETIERFQAPYRKGDDKTVEAVRAGKAQFQSYWLPSAAARMSHVAVYVTPDLGVVVDYVGPAWERESLRRRKGRAANGE